MGQKSAPGLPAAERNGAMLDGRWHHWGGQDFAMFTAPSTPTEVVMPPGESP